MIADAYLTVVSPDSVQHWYDGFAEESAPVLFIGESDQDVSRLSADVQAAGQGRRIRILSGHDSLLRDLFIAQRLRVGGTIVTSQSGFACAVGLDKVLQKRLLEWAELAVPKWGIGDGNLPEISEILCKQRDSTQSRGIEWYGDGTRGDTNCYWEEFVEGAEYSVVLFRDSGGTLVFPVVWKGRTRRDLLPPWQRLRTVPSGLPHALETQLQDAAERIGDLIEAWGFVEVEFIVPTDGEPVVTDVNPRICGTLRIAAMAALVPVFRESPTIDGVKRPSQALFAAEIPYNGEPLSEPGMVATSRLTCSGHTPGDVKRKIAAVAPDSGRGIVWPRWWNED